MKTYLKRTLLLIFLGVNIQLSFGEILLEKIELNSRYIGNRDYKARDYIKLNPGFSYIAGEKEAFSAKIDPTLIFPPDDNIYSKPDGTITEEPWNGGIVGAIPGSFNVSPMGTASYVIPIDCPGGVNNMKPNINLSYNSLGGNGLLGWGWNLSAISAITRTGSIWYYDNKLSESKLDVSDNLVLDGQRLIRLEGINLGENSIYGSEIENYTRITMKTIDGKLGFEVKTKNGVTMEYGSSNDTYVTAVGTSTPWCWLLKKVYDNNCNYMVYNYNIDNTTKEFYLTSINYTGNSNGQVIPPNTVQFVYVNRNDIQTSYIAGRKVTQSKLLTQILIKTGSQLRYKYTFDYKFEHPYNMLQKVNLEEGIGNTILNPTQIIWGDKSTSFNTPQIANSDFRPYDSEVMPSSQGKFFADITGEGQTDMIITENENIKILKADNSMSVFTTIWSHDAKDFLGSPKNISKIFPGDFDGDGKDDFFYTTKGFVGIGYVYYLVLSKGESCSKVASFDSEHNEAIVGDFDGDGKSELLIETASNKAKLYKYGNSNQFESWEIDGIEWGERALVSIGSSDKNPLDFNGNGKTDILVLHKNGYRIYEFNGTSSVVLLNSGTNPKNVTDIHVGDFNGDGKSDVIAQNADQKTYIYYSTGVNFESVYIPGLAKYSAKYFVGDYNGDGKSNVACMVYPDKVNGDSIFYGLTSMNYPYAETNPINFNRVLEFHIISFSGDNTISTRSYKTNDYRFTNLSYLLDLFSLDYNGDGKLEFLFTKNWKSSFILYPGGGDESRVVRKITDGFGRLTQIIYNTSPFSTKAYFNNKTSYTSPVYTLYPQWRLVTEYRIGDTQYQMQYDNARLHRKGKGFLGYETITVKDKKNNIQNISKYDFDATYFNVIKTETENKFLNGSSISKVQYNNVIKPIQGLRFMPYVSVETATDYLTGLTTTSTLHSMDDYGNPIKTSISKGQITETTNITYATNTNGIVSYLPSRITKEYSDGSVISRITDYTYDTKGNLLTEVSDPNTENQKITTYSGFNTFGQATAVRTEVSNAPAQSSSSQYSPTGEYTLSTTNHLTQTTTYQWDLEKGQLLQETDFSGRITSYTTDGWGNVLKTIYPDGRVASRGLRWSPSLNSIYRYYKYSVASGQSPVYVYYDKMGREIYSKTKGLNNQDIYVHKLYNTKNQLEKISKPTTTDSRVGLLYDKEYTYDTYGRVSKLKTPLGETTYNYNGLITTITTPTETVITTLNTSGQVVSKSTNGKNIAYTYYPDGQVKTTLPDGGQTITMEYDQQGNRTKLIDPDGGTITSVYDGWGNLLSESQNIHIGQAPTITTYEYNDKNILTKRLQNNVVVNAYTYDSKYRLIKETNNEGHAVTYTYDNLDRITQTEETINNKQFTKKVEYDVLGRPCKEIFPSGYYTTNHYDGNGYLVKVMDDKARSIWEAQAANLYGQSTTSKIGGKTINYTYNHLNQITSAVSDGITSQQYAYNAKGQLTNRDEQITGQGEYLTYDNFNRLTHWNTYSRGVETSVHSIIYNAITGNITSKSDLGNAQYNYGVDGSKPHALSSLSTVPTQVPSTTLNATYTDYKKLKTLSEGNKTYELRYGCDEQRRMSLYKVGGQTKETTYYLGNYEEIHQNNGTIRKIHYLSGGDGWTAVHIRTNDVDSLLYVYTDNLGSPIAITNQSHAVIERYAYDPWGQRRNPNDWAQSDTRTKRILTRGYTGHEHIDQFMIINMNGRVYDPLTAMFMSPDPYIQDPDNWLNYNRYAYCMNNPFMYTDPSGEFWHIVIGAAIGGVINVLTNLDAINDFGTGAAYFGIGALAGGLSAGIGAGIGAAMGTGTFASGFLGAKAAETVATSFISGMAMGAGAGFSAGLVGGAGNAWMQGERFWAGLGTGAVSGLAGAASGAIIGGFIGGISADLDGRNFWNGKGLSNAERIKIIQALYNRELQESGVTSLKVKNLGSTEDGNVINGLLTKGREPVFGPGGARIGYKNHEMTLSRSTLKGVLDGKTIALETFRHELLHGSDFKNGVYNKFFNATNDFVGMKEVRIQLIEALMEVRAYSASYMRTGMQQYLNGINSYTKTINDIAPKLLDILW